MILELDCGNSLIKWRVIEGASRSVAGGLAESDDALVEQLTSQQALPVRACRLVSVRSEQETSQLVARLEQLFPVSALVASSGKQLAGVRNGYLDYQRLGLDRWLALVAAHHLAKKACLVIDLGTAVTSDLVAADGVHLGGLHMPGHDPDEKPVAHPYPTYPLRRCRGPAGACQSPARAGHGRGG